MNDWKKLSFSSYRDLRELQNRKLRHFITCQLYPFTTYYRNLFNTQKNNPRYIRTVEDLRIIPFTKKEDFLSTRENPSRFLDFILKPDEALLKKYIPKNKLLSLALAKALRGKEYVKGKLEKEYRPIFLTATTGTTDQPVSFLYTNYDIENLKISG